MLCLQDGDVLDTQTQRKGSLTYYQWCGSTDRKLKQSALSRPCSPCPTCSKQAAVVSSSDYSLGAVSGALTWQQHAATCNACSAFL